MKKSLIWILALSSLLLMGCGKVEIPEEKSIAVSVQAVTNQGVENTNSFSGTTKIKDETSVTVEMGGVIKEMYASVGQDVKKGDKLLTIKGTDTENSIKQAASALELAKVSYSNTLDSTDITVESQKNQLQVNLDVAQVSYDEAKKSYDIYTELVSSGAMAENDNNYRQIVQGFEKAKINLESAQKAYDNGVAEGGKDLAEKQLQQAKTTYEIALSARNKLTLYSPVDGIITTKNFDVNETATQGQPAFIISNLNVLQVDISVTQADIDKFKKGNNVTVTIDGNEVQGTINYVPTVVNAANSLYTVEVLIDNSSRSYKAGLSADVKLSIQKQDNTIAVPKKAVLDEDGTKYVYVVSDDNKAIKTQVRTGIETDSKVEILSGITTQDTIVIGGLSLIADNTKIFPVLKED